MSEQEETAPNRRCIVVLGARNVGKSTLLNALVQARVLPDRRGEPTQTPSIITRSGQSSYRAITQNGTMCSIDEEQFQRHHQHPDSSVAGLFVGCPSWQLPSTPLVDTPGFATIDSPVPLVPAGLMATNTVAIALLDIEYWSSRHAQAFVETVQQQFSTSAVVLNKADHLNDHEICRCLERAQEAFSEADGVFALSATLELERKCGSGTRELQTPEVLALCDGQFSFLRDYLGTVANSSGAKTDGTPPLQQLDWSPVPLS